jgi:hypothetical protein
MKRLLPRAPATIGLASSETEEARYDVRERTGKFGWPLVDLPSTKFSQASIVARSAPCSSSPTAKAS